MTWRKFLDLYDAYKNLFDLELTMQMKGIRYSDLGEKDVDDVIPA